MTRADTARGVALLNATIVILMVAAVSAQLLGRSTENQRRLRISNASHQITLFLDAAAMLVPTILTDAVGDRRSFASRAAWYVKRYEFPVLDGFVGGTLHDLQTGFNLSWLRNTEDAGAEAAFGRLWQGLGLPPAALPAFLEGLRSADTGPADRPTQRLSRWTGLPAAHSGLSAAQRATLAAHVVDLDPGAGINLNTGDVLAIHAFVPQVSRSDLEAVLKHRDREAISNVDEFRFRLAAYLTPDALQEIDFDRFDTGTDWFEVRLFAQRHGQLLHSRLILRRETGRFVAVGIHALPGGAS